MNVDAIRNFCLAFPRATENLQWGDNLCLRLAGKFLSFLGWTIRGCASSALRKNSPNW